MSLLDDAQRFLPRHLTEEETAKLFEDIKMYPGNLDKRLYMTPVAEDQHAVLQGDGISGLLVVNLPEPEVKPVPALVLSNSCDADTSNNRAFPTALCYAPIFRLDKYLDALRKRQVKTEEYIVQHESDIRRQALTQIFFLPQSGRLEGDSIVFLDRINNCQNRSVDREKLPETRIFSLSQYGHWLLLLKLAIHFSRLTDKTIRSAGESGDAMH
ncbi:hypothetical protein ACVK00_003149 [Burkholderia sp. PvR073]|uniref:hypothetical protein n=1 Tax=Burkholderia ambifaria TaxID=152480 RepID=UPI00339231C5